MQLLKKEIIMAVLTGNQQTFNRTLDSEAAAWFGRDGPAAGTAAATDVDVKGLFWSEPEENSSSCNVSRHTQAVVWLKKKITLITVKCQQGWRKWDSVSDYEQTFQLFFRQTQRETIWLIWGCFYRLLCQMLVCFWGVLTVISSGQTES